MSTGADPIERRRAWISAAVVFAALLFVPFLAWLILPGPPAIPIPQVIAATEEPEAPRPTKKPVFDPAPAPKPAPSEKPAEATGTVKGSVIGPDREPIARAYVGCTDQETTHTTTEQDGTFELPAEAVGCTAVARRPGFGSSSPTKLRAGSNLLQLRAGGSIEGVVVDESGAPLAKFQIGIERFLGLDGDDDGSNGRTRTFESEKGEFLMEKMTPGKYVLAASVEGRPPVRTELFEVEPGRATKGIRIVIARGGTLTGAITDAATKRPIEGARVELDLAQSSGVSSVPSVKSDASGAYSLEGVPASGPFSIRVSKDGYRTRTVSGLSTRGASALTSDVALTAKGDGPGESELGGIGAILGPVPGALGVIVLALTKDSPAARAGLLQYDHITRIDGASTEELTLVECIQRLRGEPGTAVTIWVKRGDKELQINITRAVVIR